MIEQLKCSKFRMAPPAIGGSVCQLKIKLYGSDLTSGHLADRLVPGVLTRVLNITTQLNNVHVGITKNAQPTGIP